MSDNNKPDNKPDSNVDPTNPSWDPNKPLKSHQSLSEFLNIDYDGDTTEEDLELFGDKYVGKVDLNDEDSLNAALEAMRLDSSNDVDHLLETPRTGVFESQDRSLEVENGLKWPSLGTFDIRNDYANRLSSEQPKTDNQFKNLSTNSDDIFGPSVGNQNLKTKPVILPPPSSELFSFREPDSVDDSGVTPTPTPTVVTKNVPELTETTPPPQSTVTGQPPSTPPQNKVIDDGTDLSDFYAAISKQLSIREDQVITPDSDKALILLSPLSYKHVFSRNWVKKSYLDSIVERPERLMAASLGIGSAVAKYPSKFKVEISDKRADLTKSPHVAKVHGSKWAKELYQLCSESSDKLKNGQVEVPNDWHEGDIYLTPETVDALEGVVAVSETAIDKIFADSNQANKVFVSIRPPGHHSHPCVPSGFCLINNVHIAIQYAREKYDITHAVILDFDLHHGDGSQDICWKLAGFDEDEEEVDESDERVVKVEADTGESLTPAIESPSPSKSSRKKVKKTSLAPPLLPLSIGYFSVHDINSFPTEQGYATADNIKNASVCLMAHKMCIWNVHLEPYRDENHFNQIYKEKYSILFDKANQFLKNGQKTASDNKQIFKPLIILSAGFDSSEHEHLSMQRHQVSVPTSFFNKFTNDSVKLANEFANGKIVSMLEGGYSDAALSTGIFSHLTGLIEEEWDPNWCNPTIVKQFNRGCKLKWKPSTNTSSNASPDPEWLNNGIVLGRSLWPKEVKAQVAAVVKPAAATTGRRNRRLEEDSNNILATPLRVLRDSTRKSNVLNGL